MNTSSTSPVPTAATRGRVVVAMSGGVDSATCAALMKDAGHDVVGVTLQLYDHGRAVNRPGSCCAGQDIHDARRVADALDIPHYVLDYERKFRQAVIDDFADSYLRGETPIPCVRCNQTVKFRDLLAVADDLEAEALVTGHYVRRLDGPRGPELHRARDTDRDQSYFLFATTRAQLSRLRFPLGDRPKAETRALAERFGLPVANKPDSQDICFVPDGDYGRTVAKLRPDAFAPGEIVAEDGRVLGEHGGVAFFTVGQRRGIGIAAPDPLYVLRLEPDTNRVVVGPRSALLKDRLAVQEVNWLGDESLAGDIAVSVKLRSAMPPAPAVVHPKAEGRARITLDQPQAGIAPGQACVFYDGDRVLGGGWIERDDETEGVRPAA